MNKPPINLSIAKHEAASSLRLQRVREICNSVIPPIDMGNPVDQNIRDQGRKVLAIHIMALQDVGLEVVVPQSAHKVQHQPVQADLLVDGYWWAQEILTQGSANNPDARDDFTLGEPEIVYVQGDMATGFKGGHTTDNMATGDFFFIAPAQPPHRF